MIKAILLSIHKKHNENIESGAKLLELRKSIPKDLKEIIKNHGGIWVYSYETLSSGGRGKVTNRWWFDEYDILFYDFGIDEKKYIATPMSDEEIYWELDDEYLDKLCLSYKQVAEYGEYKNLSAWHIKKPEVFDTPMELDEFYVKKHIEEDLKWYGVITHYEEEIKRPPMSWQYVYVKELENEKNK